MLVLGSVIRTVLSFRLCSCDARCTCRENPAFRDNFSPPSSNVKPYKYVRYHRIYITEPPTSSLHGHSAQGRLLHGY